jgi:anaerobic selenocysteine-containing dehydrogenase
MPSKPSRRIDRREFMKMAATTGVGIAVTSLLPLEYIEAINAAPTSTPAAAAGPGMKLLQAACPYCGVGCGRSSRSRTAKSSAWCPTRST